MNTIIEKIRAEVNRQAKSIDTATGDFAEGRRMEQRIILSVLSDLEKECEEKPKKGLHHGSLRKVDNPMKWMIDDARMELIQQIKAEVERLKHFESSDNAWATLCELEGFLDTLQEQPVKGPFTGEQIYKFLKEQPICEGLERAVVDYFEGYWPGMETAEQCNTDLHFTPPAIMRLARHFYELGCRRTAEKYDEIEYKRQRAEESVPKDLEEAAENYAELLPQGRVSKKYSAIDFIAGAKWQKEQMMSEAVEGEVVKDISNKLAVTAKINLDGFKFGQKVRIIVVKED